MIKAIIFDCFGVLQVHKGPQFLQENVPNYEAHKAELHDLSNQADYGLLLQQEFEQAVAKLSGLPLSTVHNGLFAGIGRNEQLLTYIATKLKPKYKIGLLSNISRGSIEQFFTLKERETLFDAAVLSSEVAHIKPHPEAYEYICEKLDVDVSEAIMIDDNEDNVYGAEQAGLFGIRYEGVTKTTQELEKLLAKLSQ
jgi:FMN phosphatase YigB (HAD superfamily)